MDSRFAADPVARDILEKLALLERTAGVRAHYRILEPLPLSSTDISALQTAARMIGDWIGLRNAMFHISVGDAAVVRPGGMFVDNEQEEFSVEISRESVATPTLAMAALAQEVAHAYLIKGNITAGLQAEGPASGRAFLDITAIFLGLGKLLLNGCASAARNAGGLVPVPPCHLSPTYLAFTHRATCSMRGLDYDQHLVGLTPPAVELLHSWNSHKDTVFSLSLRNVLTASQPHRPLLDAVADNHVALARFDQLLRYSETYFLARMRRELATYHLECQEAVSRLTAREQETYDPCMVYLNQLRRRMDLQRFADGLQQQQDVILERLQILLRGINSLEDHSLLDHTSSGLSFVPPFCPLDGTQVHLPQGQREARVHCPTCGYEFLASADAPAFANGHVRSPAHGGEEPPEHVEEPKGRHKVSRPASVLHDQRIAGARTGTSASNLLLIWGLTILPLSWLPLLGYVLYGTWKGFERLPYADILGNVGLGGSALGLLLIGMGILGSLVRLFSRKKDVVVTDGTSQPSLQATPQPEA